MNFGDTVVGIYKTSETAKEPTRGTLDSACCDLYADLLGSNKGISMFTTRNDALKVSYGSAKNITVYPENGAVVVRPGDRVLVPTGVIFDIPSGFCIKVYPRSGSSFKHGLTLINAVGVIDSDYVDELYIPLVNMSDATQLIKHGDRLAQMELCPVHVPVFNFLEKSPDKKTDRDGGIGSTGI